MLVLQTLTDIAMSAVALLVAVLAIYLSVRLLGKLAKFFIILIVVLLALWFVLGGGFVGGAVFVARNGAAFL